VKELVENSLDAGATRIQVEVRRGGLEEVRVLDDGEGMDGADLELSLQRHATSKIGKLEDLHSLSTLGFRGEALASIASVSRWKLESSPDESGEGTRISGEGGNPGVPEAVGHPRGTTVFIRDLFFNTPARRKFLRSEGAESDQVLDVLLRAAL